MISIPQELIEQITGGNVLLFVGERALRDSQSRVIPDVLAEDLAQRLADAEAFARSAVDGYRFPQAAQMYEDENGRYALVHLLRERLELLGGDEPQPLHRLIAALTDIRVLVTTCVDGRLERALRQAGRPYHAIVHELDVAFEDEQKVLLYKLRGSLERPDSLVLTEDDYEGFFEHDTNISVVLQSYLARKTILFIGYDLEDAGFKRLYRKVTGRLDNYARRAYAFGEALSPAVLGWGHRHGVQIIVADTQTFLEALTAQLKAHSRPAVVDRTPPAAGATEPLQALPYRRLDYYDRQDAAGFFGRLSEIQELSARIHAHRLVLLYGGSGVGKTSLLLAGVVPRLESADPAYACLYVRGLDDPAQAIRLLLQRRLPDADLPLDGPLVDLVSAAAKVLGQPLVIILDQFEEFFIPPGAASRASFAAELRVLHDARDVPVKVVLSLREDWLAAIGELEQQLPAVFQTRMRLLPLTRDQASQAIIRPVERLGIAYEPSVLERLLDDLVESEAGAIMPPQLQIVCSTLYAGLAPGERVITLAVYERLGGARGMLLRYLEEELQRFLPAERGLARSVLEALVTSQRTKRVASRSELRHDLRGEEAGLDAVLEKLVQARLVRSIQPVALAEPAFELAHEYLIDQITLSPEARARKEAEELLRLGVETWRRYGTLLSDDAVALIDARQDLLHPSAAEEALLERSRRRHAKRFERVVVGVMAGLAGGGAGGVLGTVIWLALGLGRSNTTPQGLMLGNGIASAFFGALFGLGICLGRVLFPRRAIAPIVGGIVTGLLLGVPWDVSLTMRATPWPSGIALARVLLAGALLGGGLAGSIDLGSRLRSPGLRLLSWVGLGGMIAEVCAIVGGPPELALLSIVVAAGIATGLGLATYRYKP